MTPTKLLTAFALSSALAASGCGGGGDGGGDGLPGTASVPAIQGDPIAGHDAFILGTDPACGDCHTLADAGTTGTKGPNLDETKPTFDEVIDAVKTKHPDIPEYADLTPGFLENIAAFVSSNAGKTP
jgi:mono/diheme cytochrome c family protein